MRVKSRSLFIKKDGVVSRHSFRTNRAFYRAIRACSGESYRVLVKYYDDKNEYDCEPLNDSGWYKSKKKLLKTAKAFIDG